MSVDCPVVGDCTAIGGYHDSIGYDYGVIDTLANGSWQTVTAPQPSNSGDDADHNQEADLEALSCSSTSFCAVVGSYNDDSIMDYQYGLIETGSGTNWSATAAPEPANAGTDTDGDQSAELLGVSCSSDGNCAAGRRLRR